MTTQGGAWLAQINVARARAALDDPLMADFVANLDRINRLAEASPGFVWRLKDDYGAATTLRLFPDPLLLVNMSVWESPEHLADYVHRSAHAEFLRRRREWFEAPTERSQAMWWVSEGHLPDLDEGRERLMLIRRDGPGPSAFDFKTIQRPSRPTA